MSLSLCSSFFFFFNDTATTEIYTLSLHDALPISPRQSPAGQRRIRPTVRPLQGNPVADQMPGERSRTRRRLWESHRPAPHKDRKSTRLNSSHGYISYAVFCLKKKKRKR